MLDRALPLLVVGGGKMAEALLRGWSAGGLPSRNVWVVEPEAERRHLLEGSRLARPVAAAADLPPDLVPAAVVVALKPQAVDAAMPSYAGRRAGGTLILSIAAGKPIAALEAIFGVEAAIVRAMPNTPAAIGRGVAVLCANAACGSAQRELAFALMRAVGDAHWLDDEDGLHAVTATSGSGPAYVFHLIEALAEAAIAAGLPAALAMALARRTVEGAAELAHASPETAGRLRASVTSPGGTTAAALEVLQDERRGLRPLLRDAVAAAAARSRELA